MTVEANTSGRVQGVDATRGLAAIAVFICHIGGYWTFLSLPGKLPELIAVGAHGVDVFIVISGFCLALAVRDPVRPTIDRRTFWGRRAWRILPPYYAALAVAAALAMSASTWHLTVARQASWADLLAHVAAVQTWIPSTLGTINGSLWSVSLEIQLYVVFPVLVLAWRRWGIRTLVVVALAVDLVWRALGQLGPGVGLDSGLLGSEFVLPGRIGQFVVGMGCAVIVKTIPLPATRVLVSSFVATGLVAIAASTLEMYLVTGLLWALVGGATVLMLAGVVGPMLARTWLETFGARSFSFYLLHQPGLLVCAGLVALLPGGWPVQVVVGGTVCFVLVAGCAWLLHRFVELPSHLEGRRRFPTARPDSVQTGVPVRD